MQVGLTAFICLRSRAIPHACNCGRETPPIPISHAYLQVLQYSQDENTDLFTRSLIAPIGDYRRRNVVRSMGKRDKKRRKLGLRSADKASDDALQGEALAELIPAPPAIGAFLTIGYNSTIRCLDNMSRAATPEIFRVTADRSDAYVDPKAAQSLSAVFVDRSNQPDILYGQLPVLIYTASLGRPAGSPIRLITLPSGAGERISTSLNIPRVSIIGILELAPNAESLLRFIEQKVAPVEIKWLTKIATGNYLPVNIEAKRVTPAVNVRNSQKQTKSPALHKAKQDQGAAELEPLAVS